MNFCKELWLSVKLLWNAGDISFKWGLGRLLYGVKPAKLCDIPATNSCTQINPLLMLMVDHISSGSLKITYEVMLLLLRKEIPAFP